MRLVHTDHLNEVFETNEMMVIAHAGEEADFCPGFSNSVTIMITIFKKYRIKKY